MSMSRRAGIGLGLVVLLVAYLLLWPVPLSPVAWKAPALGGYRGAHAKNSRLAEAQQVPVAPEVGPEHIVFGPDGRLYTGTSSGKVLRMNADGGGVETFVDTGGRPLGLDFDAAGTLIVAESFLGRLAVGADRQVRVLTDEAAGSPILYADAVVVAGDGRMLFTDASQRHDAKRHGTFDASVLDILEHSCTGRVLEFDPGTGATRVLIGGLCFPNGVALAADQRHYFIAETGEYRIWKVARDAAGLDARAAVAGNDDRARVILANLPGFPDNLTRGEDGRLWTGFTKPRSNLIDRMSDKPTLRAITLRLPKFLWPVPPAYGHIIAFDEQGRVVADLQDPEGRLPETSGATERGGRIYVQSLHAPAFAVIDRSAAGL
jgi:sugar lactone lactonase YvrE